MKKNKIHSLLIFTVIILLSCSNSKKIINTRKTYTNGDDTVRCIVPSYSEYFSVPKGLIGYFDYEEGLNCSKSKNKPYLIYFSGHNSSKSAEMEAKVWTNKEIIKILKKNYIVTCLYVDDKMLLSPQKQVDAGDKYGVIKTYGKKCLYIQETRFKENTQPSFYIINNQQKLLVEPFHYSVSVDSFKTFLEMGIEEYYKQ